MKRWHRWCCGAAAAALGQAWAQSEAGARQEVWVEPRIGFTQTFTDNASFSAGAPKSEQITQVSPGVRIVANSARVKGFFDYALSGVYRAQGTSGDSVVHALNTNAQVSAVDNFAFVDLDGVVSQQAISAFGPDPVAATSNTNQAQTVRVRVSPYLKGELPFDVNYEARYNFQSTQTQAANISDSTIHGWSGRLSRVVGTVVGLSADASHEQIDYSRGRQTTLSALAGNLSYAVTPQLVGTVTLGTESNNQLTLDQKRYTNVGAGLDWRLSERTRFNVGVNDRYFGTGHNVSAEHRGAKTVVRYTDTRDVVNTPAANVNASLGSLYGLLDTLYQGIEPDPVLRAQLIQTSLNKLGLPADTQVNQSFLASQATLQRNQQVSVLLIGVRSSLTLSVTRGNTRRLQNNLTLGDDFDFSSSVKTRGWSLMYAHRLTPVTSANAMYTVRKSEGTSTSFANSEYTQYTMSLGLTTSLGPRTAGSLQVRRTNSNSGLSPFTETAVVGNIIHRF